MSNHCKGCIYLNKGNAGTAGTKYADGWCVVHSNIVRKARSLCILRGSKKETSE